MWSRDRTRSRVRILSCLDPQPSHRSIARGVRTICSTSMRPRRVRRVMASPSATPAAVEAVIKRCCVSASDICKRAMSAVSTATRPSAVSRAAEAAAAAAKARWSSPVMRASASATATPAKTAVTPVRRRKAGWRKQQQHALVQPMRESMCGRKRPQSPIPMERHCCCVRSTASISRRMTACAARISWMRVSSCSARASTAAWRSSCALCPTGLRPCRCESAWTAGGLACDCRTHQYDDALTAVEVEPLTART